ncbi:MAG: rod shape-determining protein RodA [Myxococcales bacterium]|nr:rod shape-determining protein RodA [Myxococcales bacterium]
MIGLDRHLRRHFDWMLTGLVLLVAVIGLVNLYSATRHVPQHGLFSTQVVWMVIGAGIFGATALIDYRNWTRVAWILLLLGIVAVAGVHFIGISVKGSRRWLGLGGLRVQPSEFMKLAVILAIARLVHERDALSLFSRVSRVVAIFGAVLLIAWQPDLGTATLVGLIVATVALVAARRLWPVLVGGGVLAAGAPLLWWYVLHDYQKLRILTFLDPASDPSGAGWHSRQSIFAVGSGRLFGKRWLHGTQNQLNFLPEQWTDFPFSVWAEEWGFAGASLLVLAYAALVFWIVHIARQARDRFGATLCVGVAAMLFWHVFVNIAMVTGLAPVVGITLPLVSYGRSSLVTFCIALGLVASVSLRRFAR